MKRWLVIGGVILLISYIIAYRFLRGATMVVRNAEVFVHTRDFRYEWEARLFYPAAYVEWLLFSSSAHTPIRSATVEPFNSESFCELINAITFGRGSPSRTGGCGATLTSQPIAPVDSRKHSEPIADGVLKA